jgi:antitoxin (DNA-binding transcriptional repressor) of toxin-antitoxin stability system
LVITRADKPVAEIKPVSHDARRPRPFGLGAGQFTVPDDFDDPLTDDSCIGIPSTASSSARPSNTT